MQIHVYTKTYTQMLPQRYSKPPETGTTQMFFNWKMDKQTAVPPIE